MLTLVHPAREGQDPPKKKGRPAASLALTEEEARHVAAAIRNLTPRHGARTLLAAKLGVHPDTLNKPSPGLAIAIARELRLSVDALLTGKMVRAGTCPTCGARPTAQAERAGGAR